MRFHALALCLAGMAAAAVQAQDQNTQAPMPGPSDTMMRPTDREMRPTDREKQRMDRDVVGTHTYAGETIYVRDVLYPDLPPVEEVAAKVTAITEVNKRDAAELAAAAARARTAGWTNVAAVYEYMAQDHNRGAEMASTWLVSYGYTPPPAPTVTTVADMPVQESIPYWIEHHRQRYQQAAERRQTEPSSTVRGLLLMNMATELNHISLLQSLQTDVARNRRTLSARLEAQMNPLGTALTEERVASIVEEERAYFASLPQPTPPVVVQERVIERRVEVPVERVVERVVEKPVERIVERRVYIERPVTRTAGQRQAVRKRRPAK